ncbi:MAG: hydrogenase maturation nickel metallochaperone HypA [Calditrichia bacterium]
MHEMSIAQNILEIVKEYLGNEHKKLLSVTVEVGELTAVIPESLQFCFEAVLAETPYPDARLIIKQIPLSGQCEQCGKVFKIENYLFTCPECKSIQIKVLNGQELKVTELEVE